MGLLLAWSRSNNTITLASRKSRAANKHVSAIKAAMAHATTTKHLLPISVCLVLFYYTIKYIIMQ